MRLLGRGFHTLIKNVSFSSPTDVDFTVIKQKKINWLCAPLVRIEFVSYSTMSFN